MQDFLERILITEEEIQARVAELASRITQDYKDKNLGLIGILKGGVVFLADLTRQIPIPHSYDLVGASSYGSSSTSSGKVIITRDAEIPLSDKDILIIEDIYDTGNTLKVVRDLIEAHSPRSMEICALLWKEKKRAFDIPIRYIGFKIPDVFVVGYGLDFNERYRNLGYIGVLSAYLKTRNE